MKIILDQRTCGCHTPACEAHFGWHFLREEVTPVDCTVSIEEDEHVERTFIITDRDGSQKILVVDENNAADAYDSWRLAWEAQQGRSEE